MADVDSAGDTDEFLRGSCLGVVEQGLLFLADVFFEGTEHVFGGRQAGLEVLGEGLV